MDDRNGKFLRGDKTAARFQEFWTFAWCEGGWRLRGIEQSRDSDVLKRENLFEQFTDAQVEHIYQDKVEMNGPVGNWMDKDMATRAVQIERMLNFLVQTDKHWNRQDMISRTIKVFTELYMARELGELSPLVGGMLFPRSVGGFGRRNSAGKKQMGLCSSSAISACARWNWYRCAIAPMITRMSFDAYISAHAQRTMLRNNEIVLQEEYVTPFEEYWTFGRLEGEWKLKEILAQERGQEAVRSENVDEDSCREQLQWYYTKKRA